ncbi:MAG: hypothetical protein CMB80_13945 [Flammeovirgaceae bacterium]|nr:hypothetical protein [Flammeovirgaceae bacterium]
MISVCYVLISAPVLSQSTEYQLVVDGELVALTFQDSTDWIKGVDELLLTWWKQGYVFSGVDSVMDKTTYLHKGEKVGIYNVQLSTYNSDLDSFVVNEQVDGDNIWKLIDSQIKYYRNSGYPFAQAKIHTIEHGHEWSSQVKINPGPFIKFDSLILINEVNIGRQYLNNILKTNSDQPYSEDVFEAIPDKLKRLPFLELNEMPDVTFVDGKAQVYLNLKESKQSSFEGVVGFLPQSNTNDLIITGYLDLTLANLLKSGKSLQFSWNRFADQSQSTAISYSHPYFLSSPLFVNVGFHLLKQDTSFLNQIWQLETGTYLGNSSELFFGFNSENGSLISPDELDLETGVADFESKVYQLGLRSSYANLPFDLGKHFKYLLNVGIGDKRLNRNPGIDQMAYDSLDLLTQKISVKGFTRTQWPVTPTLFVYHEIRGQLLYNDQLLVNELARIGGLKSLRGFNENFYFAKDYLLSRLELRQYFEQRSYFMLFYDAMYLHSLTDTSYPQGFGLGLNLNTSNGLFTFATAIGKESNLPMDFANIKVHIGYSSRF